MIQENVVTNICVWDGDITSWQPPTDAMMLLQANTPTKIWGVNQDETDYVLVNSIGDADIGFTYENGICITNQEKPLIPTEEK